MSRKKNLERIDRIQKAINKLDRNKIHQLYFSYDINLYNLWHNYGIVATKLLSLFTGKKSIDHITHISRFIKDQLTDNYIVKIFEANVIRGMEENYLIDRLKNFRGTCYIRTFDKEVNKIKADEFRNQYIGVPYSKSLAILSGLDMKYFESKPKVINSGFCSWLEALFMINQGIDISHIEKGNPLEIVPEDLYSGLDKWGKVKILYKYKK